MAPPAVGGAHTRWRRPSVWFVNYANYANYSFVCRQRVLVGQWPLGYADHGRPRYVSSPCITSPPLRETDASGGGLFVAPINAPQTGLWVLRSGVFRCDAPLDLTMSFLIIFALFAI